MPKAYGKRKRTKKGGRKSKKRQFKSKGKSYKTSRKVGVSRYGGKRKMRKGAHHRMPSEARARLAFAISTKNTIGISLTSALGVNHGLQLGHATVNIDDPLTVSTLLTALTAAHVVDPSEVAQVDTVYTKDWKAHAEYTNCSNMDYYVCAYLCVARKDIPLSETSSLAIYQAGFADPREINPTASSIIASTTIGITPYQNRRFCEYYKVVKVVKQTLLAGRSMHLSLLDKNPKRWTLTGTAEYIGHRSKSKFWLVNFRGQTVNDNTGAVGPVFPAVSTSPVLVDCVQTQFFQWCVKDQDFQEEFGPVKLSTAMASAGQRIFPYVGGTAQGFSHAWNTFPVT